MLKLSLGSFALFIESGFAVIALGRRQVWWSRLDGFNVDHVPEGYSRGF